MGQQAQWTGYGLSVAMMRRPLTLAVLLSIAVFSIFVLVKNDSFLDINFSRPRGRSCYEYGPLEDRVIVSGIHEDTVEGWRMRRLKHLEQFGSQVHFGPDPGDVGLNWGGNRSYGHVYFQDNWEPTFSCPYEIRLGHWGDGGKWICNPNNIKRPAVVYSLGSNNEFSFEQSMFNYFDGEVEIHTFDAGDAPNKPAFVTYHQHYVGPDGVINNKTSKSLPTILAELNHTHIDVFKVDIEGHEMESMLPMLESGSWPREIKQMQIEIHLFPLSFPVIPSQVDKFFTLLSSHYQMEIFHKEPNIKFGGGMATEFSLAQVDWKTILDEAGLKC